MRATTQITDAREAEDSVTRSGRRLMRLVDVGPLGAGGQNEADETPLQA